MRLYLGNLDVSVETDDLYDLLVKYGHVTSVCIKPGFAFVEFAQGANTAAAKTDLQGHEVKGKKITVQDPKDGQPRTPHPIDSVCVRLIDVPSSATWQQVQTLASECGVVTRAETYHTNPATKLQRVVLAFDSLASADACVAKFNGFTMDTHVIRAYLSVKYKPRAPKPARAGAVAGAGAAAARPVVGKDAAAFPVFGGESGDDIPLRLLLPNQVIGAVIGKGGAVIREISEKTGAKIDVQRRDALPLAQDRLVTVMGATDAVANTYREIVRRVEEDLSANPAANGDKKEDASTVPLRMLIGNELVGHLIGKAGATIKSIMASTHATITINTNDDGLLLPMNCRIVTATGTLDERCAAQNAILQRLRTVVKAHPPVMPLQQPVPYAFPGVVVPGAPAGVRVPGYMPLPSEKTVVHCPNRLVGAVIGKGGQNVKEIMAQSSAHVRVIKGEEEEEEMDDNTERKIVITGTVDAQFKAQQLIYMKFAEQAMMTSPPGANGYNGEVVMKITVPIPYQCVGRVIGKQGSRIREISQVSGARIEVSKPESPTENATVTISGVFSPCQVAQNLIRNVISEHMMRDSMVGGGDKQ